MYMYIKHMRSKQRVFYILKKIFDNEAHSRNYYKGAIEHEKNAFLNVFIIKYKEFSYVYYFKLMFTIIRRYIYIYFNFYLKLS